jgi:hypothetical protein
MNRDVEWEKESRGQGLEREMEIKRSESTVPIQSRVNVVDLANLDIYWHSQGYGVRTMSQLVAWSVELLSKIIEENRAIDPEHRIDTVKDAVRYMNARGLFQRSMIKMGREKLATALRFESMREDGYDPKTVGAEGTRKGINPQYSMLHNRHVERMPQPKTVNTGIYRDIIDEAFIRADEEKKKELIKLKADTLAAARASGLIVEGEQLSREEAVAKAMERRKGGPRMTDREYEDACKMVLKEGMTNEELESYNEERERRIKEKENAPVDMKEMVFANE